MNNSLNSSLSNGLNNGLGKKLGKQKIVGWAGEVIEVGSHAMLWGTVANFGMISGTFYFTTLRYLWPWFKFPYFAVAFAVAAVVVYVIEYKFLVPSVWAFRNRQMFQESNLVMDKLKEIEDRLAKMDTTIKDFTTSKSDKPTMQDSAPNHSPCPSVTTGARDNGKGDGVGCLGDVR